MGDFFKDLLVEADAVMLILDSKGIIKACNEKLLRVYGYEEKELVGKNVFILHSKKDNLCDVMDNITTLDMRPNIYLHKTKEGLEFLVETKTVFFKHNEELFQKTVIVTDVYFINFKKRLDEKIKKSDKRYKLTLDKADVGIGLVTVNGQFVEVNQKLCDIFGRDLEEMLKLNVIDMTHPDDLDFSRKIIRKFLKGKNDRVRYKKKYIKKDKSIIYAEVSITASRDQHGKIEYMNVSIADITEKTLREEEWITIEKIESVQVFIRGTCHELNNPLGGIMQNAQVVLSRLMSDNENNLKTLNDLGIDFNKFQEYIKIREIDKMLDNIMDAGKKAARVVRELSDFSKVSRTITEENLNSILDQALKIIRFTYNLIIGFDLDDVIEKDFFSKVLMIKCKRSNLEQVFIEILKNSIEAIIKKKEQNFKPKIVIKFFVENNEICIAIVDNGIGMSPDLCKKAFQGHRGRGLLSSFAYITNSHKGRITINSREGEGTEVCVFIPLGN